MIGIALGEHGKNGHVNTIESSYPWIWYISPSMYIFINFSQLCFLVFGIVLLHIFIKFFPGYLIFFGSIVYCIFLISCSNCSLLVYRNEIDFYILTLYSVTLLNSLISCHFFWIPWGFICTQSYCLWLSPVLLFFSIVMSFMYLSSFVALVRVSNVMLKRSSENSHICLVFNLNH